MASVRLRLGWDRGNERTNAATFGPNGALVEIDYSSLVSEGNLADYKAVKSGSSLQDGIQPMGTAESWVEYEGITYFIGDFATEGKNATNGYSDLGRYKGKHTKVSLMASCATLASRLYPYQQVQEMAVTLVMGVPIQAYNDQAAGIVEALTGTYRFTYNYREYVLHVDTVNVFMEGAGAAIYSGQLDTSATIGVIDGGSFTTNLLLFRGHKAVSKDCLSFPIGVGTLTERVNRWFMHKYDRGLETTEQQKLLRASIGQVDYPSIWVDGEQVSEAQLREWMRQATAETNEDRNTRIAQAWDKQTIKSFKTALHSGGGAYYFHRSIQTIIKSAVMVDVPERVNARGFAALAVQIAQRKQQQQLQRGA